MKLSHFALYFLLISSLLSCTTKHKKKDQSKAQTFVLVHGAFQDAQSWKDVKLHLEKEGHQVIVLDLPGRGCTGTPAELNLEAYKKKVIEALTAVNGQVYLVGHSFGGMTISNVAEEIPNKVAALIYVAAYLPSSGDSLQTLSGSDPDSLLGKKGNFVLSPDYKCASINDAAKAEAFATGANSEESARIVESLKAESLGPMGEKVVLTANNYGAVPKFYVKTTLDRTVSPKLQHNMVAKTPVLKVYEIESGHAPFVTKANELSQKLIEVTRETELVRSAKVSEFQTGTFLENLLITSEGKILVVSHLDGTVWEVSPSGEKKIFLRIPESTLAGISANRDGMITVVGTENKIPSIFMVDASGKVTAKVRIPQAIFLNGLSALSNGDLLITDSYKGVIWKFSPKDKRVKVWLKDDKFLRALESDPTPGINGIKVDNKDNVYVTSTQKKLVMKIAAVNGSATNVEVIRQNLNGDDLFVEQDGTLLITTHTQNTLVKITPDGRMRQLAGAREGLVGPTAISVLTNGSRRQYVITTTGGLFSPPKSGPEVARIVMVDAGE